MKTLIGAGFIAATLALSGAASIGSAGAATLNAGAQTTESSKLIHSSGATDVSARRRIHRSHKAYRSHRGHRSRVYVRGPRPVYYQRPYDFYPYRSIPPFFPFGLGYGLDPSW